ncbi:MAG TPA: tetratricopeptide repeat protein [Steroidobacteraceae bacterium]|nr:tetratricopeptide repeat protein [Steroidobacteraceae bacterium]
MRIRLHVLSACVLVASAPTAWSNGGGPEPEMRAPREQTPEEKAKTLYNQGVKDVKKADKFQASALQLTDAGKKDRAVKEAQEYYSSALTRFQQAAQTNPQMPEAWNYVGYTNRHLGNYDAALTAYERALSLKPGYADALEYRGEAFLGLNRVGDAKQAYLDLFAGNRQLADKLLAAMRGWLDAQKASASADAAAVSDMDKWIQERSTIAGQTAALTREGTAASWK